MKVNEAKIEQLLNIKTSGRDDTRSNTFNYPYEPTEYAVLERLVQSGLIKKKNTLIDYGSGKGRVPFYISYETGCRSIGVEYDERLYSKALQNSEKYIKADKVSFVNENAVSYQIPKEADRYFFFNPFSVEILRSVVGKIIAKRSEAGCEGEEYLFFYFPSDEYVAFLMQENRLSFYDEIDCQDIFPKSCDSKRERILIFEIC